MKTSKEFFEEQQITGIQRANVKQSAAYIFVKELSEALNISLESDTTSRTVVPFYYISENGLSVFTHDHKVAVVYQPREDVEPTTNYFFPNKDLKQAIYDAYKEARIEIAKQKQENMETEVL